MSIPVDLVEFEPEHFDQLIAWSPTPDFLLQWAGPSMQFPLDRAQLEELRHQPGHHYTVMEGGRVVGHAEIGRIDAAAGTAWLMRILVGDRADRGRGLGRAIVEKLVRIAFHELGLERIYLHVIKTNEAAIRLYGSLGFVPCDPVLPRPDTIQAMSLERSDWHRENPGDGRFDHSS